MIRLPALDKTCWNCQGGGRYLYDGDKSPSICHVCRGKKRIPTRFGHKVLASLRRRNAL